MAAGALSAVVLVFAFSLGLRVTEHIRVDTIAKWTGHLWISSRSGTSSSRKSGRTTTSERPRPSAPTWHSGASTAKEVVPWLMSYCEMQGGAKR